MLLRLTLICCFSGRAALQKRIMALLRQLDSQTAGNFQVLSNLVNFYAFWIQAKNWITIPSLMSNSNFVSFHSQAWESTYTKWQKLTFDLVNFGKDDSPSIDVQKYLRRRSHAKITTDNLQVHLYTFNFLATIRDQDRIYPFNIKQTFGCNSEKYKGIVNRSNTKFCDIHYKDCKADSKENYYWDLKSERVNSNLWIV